jgi:hypothetical protein
MLLMFTNCTNCVYLDPNINKCYKGCKVCLNYAINLQISSIHENNGQAGAELCQAQAQVILAS